MVVLQTNYVSLISGNSPDNGTKTGLKWLEKQPVLKNLTKTQTNKKCSERTSDTDKTTAQECFKKLKESLGPSKQNVKKWEVGRDFCTVKYNTLI